MGANNSEVIELSLGFVSVFLIRGDDGVVLVDAGTPGKADQILELARANGIEPESIRLIAITHVHGDHTGSLAELTRRTGARVAVGAAEATLLAEGRSAPIVPQSRLVGVMTRLVPETRYEPCDPTIIDEVTDRLDLTPFGVDGELVATPGHTPGSISLVVPGRFAVIGDLLMVFSPWARRPGWPILAMDRAEVVDSVERVLEHRPHVFWLSHGGQFPPWLGRDAQFSADSVRSLLEDGWASA